MTKAEPSQASKMWAYGIAAALVIGVGACYVAGDAETPSASDTSSPCTTYQKTFVAVVGTDDLGRDNGLIEGGVQNAC